MKKKAFLGLVFLPLLLSCQSPLINVNNNSAYNYSNVLPIKGNVDFPNLTKFNIKANISDIVSDSTVSLIYPSNHLVNPNKTIATGLTDKNGNFVINPNFRPIVNEILVLESSKRLGNYGSFLMSLRTLVKWNGNAWVSITGENISINNKTTALTGMVSLLSPSVSYEDAMNSIVNGEPTDIKNKENGSVVIKSSSVLSVSELVDFALSKNQDPISYLKHENNSFKLKEPDSITSTITTIAGGFSNNQIKATDSFIDLSDHPIEDIVLDDEGNLYFAENTRIRKVNLETNIISTIAGTGDTSYTLNSNLAINSQVSFIKNLRMGDNKNLYFLDSVGLRKIDLKTGILSTIIKAPYLDNPNNNSESLISEKIDVKLFEIKNNNIYISDGGDLKKIDLKTGTLSQVVKWNVFDSNYKIFCVDNNDNLYFYDFNAQAIEKIDTKSLNRSIIYSMPNNYYYKPIIKLNPSNKELYFTENYKLKKINLETNEVTQIIQTEPNQEPSGDNSAISINILNINNIEFDLDGNIYVKELNNLKKIDKSTNTISIIATDTYYELPRTDLANNKKAIFLKDNSLYYVSPYKIKSVNLKTNISNDIVGKYSTSLKDGLKATDLPIIVYDSSIISLDSFDNIYFYTLRNGQIQKIDSKTNIVSTIAGIERTFPSSTREIQDTGLASEYPINLTSMCFDKSDNIIFYDSKNIRKIDIKTGVVSTIYKIPNSLKSFNFNNKITLDSQDNIYFFDHPYIKKIDIKTGGVSNYLESLINYYSGDSLFGNKDESNNYLKEVTAMSFDKFDNLYFSQALGGIRKFDKNTGLVSEIDYPNKPIVYGIVFDKEGNMYFSDSVSNQIKKLDMKTNKTSVIAGNGETGYYQNGDGGEPRLAKMQPRQLAMDSKGNLYVTDGVAIRKIAFSKPAVQN